mmetsp:Transcript_11433/g.27967  ORF Transcript_11433/g.27967 Transcript_11433/m.27967 type:complete len:273 (-) Transcript_11433:275-1093(-)
MNAGGQSLRGRASLVPLVPAPLPSLPALSFFLSLLPPAASLVPLPLVWPPGCMMAAADVDASVAVTMPSNASPSLKGCHLEGSNASPSCHSLLDRCMAYGYTHTRTPLGIVNLPSSCVSSAASRTRPSPNAGYRRSASRTTASSSGTRPTVSIVSRSGLLTSPCCSSSAYSASCTCGCCASSLSAYAVTWPGAMPPASSRDPSSASGTLSGTGLAVLGSLMRVSCAAAVTSASTGGPRFLRLAHSWEMNACRMWYFCRPSAYESLAHHSHAR